MSVVNTNIEQHAQMKARVDAIVGTLNSDVTQLAEALAANTKLIERNNILYKNGTGLYTIAQNVKKYVKRTKLQEKTISVITNTFVKALLNIK